MQQDTQLRDVTEGSPWGDTRMGAESRSPRALEPWTASTRYPTQKQLLRVRAELASSQDRCPGATVMRCSGEPRLTGPEPGTASTGYRTQKQLLRVRAEHAAHRTDAPVLPSAAARLGVDGSRIRRSGTGAVLGN